MVFIDFVWLGASKNRPEIDAKTHSKKTLKKDLEKIGFGFRFGFQKPPQNPPKSQKNASQSDVERSLFREAMETAPTSAEINGTRALFGIQMATHMIRSSPSIRLFIYP